MDIKTKKEIVNLYKNWTTLNEIQKRYKCSYWTVIKTLKEYGVPLRGMSWVNHNVKERKCRICNIIKPINEFYLTGHSKIHRHRACKKCLGVYKKAYHNKRRKYFLKLSLIRQKTPKGKYNSARISARRKKVPFAISRDYFVLLCNSQCIYCGITPAMGVDRIIPKRGYVLGNTESCCFKCNRGKFLDKPQEYLDHCKKVVKFQKGGGIWGAKS